MKDDIDQKKRDLVLAEWILKISVIEKALLSKGILTENDIAASAMEINEKMNAFVKLAQTLEPSDE